MAKGTQAKEELPENWERREKKFCLLKKKLRGEASDQGGNVRFSSINQSLNNLTEWLGNAMLPSETLEIYI